MSVESDYSKIRAIFSSLDGDIHHSKGRRLKFRVYITEQFYKTDIDELQLSVRSTNCLKRSKIYTVGQLCDSINGSEDLKHIRNCGKTSVAEIMDSLFAYQYAVLSPEKRANYLQTVIEMNMADD